ncbi:mucoidy inhibitor MuiA family protein [Comamonas thiooxydans]|uniref:mucoidy inhibitor MuiA family protein n=1 Tax=Comamonas thiooxydans TaxID=363952 RepID=UPI000A2DC0DA|nr:mucoidy inhibitor MuiA family protein [Comamonas thiooxydans]BDR11698.1 mucoidy inhibitor MuiA family protein [Comamonas thiooxydans]
MRSSRLLPVSMVCVAATLPGLALADASSLSVSGNRAPITEVTLYPGIAAIQREARIDAQTRLLSFECLPASVDTQSLQISGDEGVRVGEIKTLMQSRQMAAKECTSPLDQQIRSLEDQLASIEAEEGAARLVGDFLQGMSKPGDEARISPAQIAGTSQVLRQTSRDNSLRAHQIQRQKQDLLAQLQPLRQERDRTGSEQSQVMKVSVQLASARAANVRLSYQVRGPSWQPSYRAQLNTARQQVQLERQALVVQASGEDWSNVRLRLSTGQPGRSTQGVMPRPWTVDIAQPLPPAAPAPAPVAMMARGGARAMREEAAAPDLPVLDVSSINTAYSTQFIVPYKISVPSSAERITLSLGQENLATSLLTRTAPAMEEAAYLIATLQAPPGIWPAGPVALFRDEALVGNGRLDFGNAQALAQGLSFGRDDNVVVRRLPAQSHTGSGGWAGSKTERSIVRSYAVENRHNQPIALQVLDSAPVSRNEQIKVQSQYNPQPATTSWNTQNGMVAWEQNLAARSTAQFQATHQIRFPENQPISGLQ